LLMVPSGAGLNFQHGRGKGQEQAATPMWQPVRRAGSDPDTAP
jgi:hypothetical protein